MFPSNLHKNIVQLDRQISLLEKECENMEAETKKKNKKSEPMNSKSSRISNLHLKSPKITKKNESLKRNKSTPPRNHSSSSMRSHCSKSWNDNYGTSSGRKTKSCGGNNYLQGCTCQTVNYTQHNLKNDYKYRSPGFNERKALDDNKTDHVLHKEVLIPNPGSTIEVTVTQKPKYKDDSPVVKGMNANSDREKCKCQAKGPKWSELLYLESAKNKEINKNSAKSETLTGVRNLVSPSFNIDSKALKQNISQRSNRKDDILKECFEAPVKLSSELFTNKINEINLKKLEEKMQYCSESNNCEENKNVQNESHKKSPFASSSSRDLPEIIKNNASCTVSGPNNDFFHKFQQNCDNLTREKEKLAKELAAKENTLKTMKKREEEYVSLITSLKSSLTKLQEKSQENDNIRKELNAITAKLDDQKKITEAIKKRHITLQGMFERCALENHKLQTQIKLLKLESQKHDVLLAGKDAEINKYRDEIKNFQRLLSDHIELLKSNSQGLDAEKMMESIIQQSQLLFRTDLNSIFEEKDSSKPNALMHSSPTSSKTSVLNSSWDQISSIHDRSKEESELTTIHVREDSNDEKEFFQIFGDASSSNSKSPETLVDKVSKKVKNSTSFTSCESLREGSESSDSPEKEESEPDENKVTLRKVKSNIDELLKNLKSKWSKEILESSGVDSTIKDFLNESQISSITQ